MSTIHNDFDDDSTTPRQTPKKRYTDIMVDLETLDVTPRAAILSIGAVAFDLAEQETVRDFLYGVDCTARSFECVIDLDRQERSVKASTLRWWMQQSDQARKVFAAEGSHITEALNEFGWWMESVGRSAEGETRLWGNGAAFDNAILRDAYAQRDIEHPHPISFRRDMCYRTMKAMLHPGPVEVKDKELLTAHNARHDAIYQAVVLQKIWATTKAFGLMNGSA